MSDFNRLLLDALKAKHRKKKKKKKKTRKYASLELSELTAVMIKGLSLDMSAAPGKITLDYEVDDEVDLSDEEVSDEEIEFLHSFTHAVYTRIDNGTKVADWTLKKANTFHEKIIAEMDDRDIDHEGEADLSKALTVSDAGTVLVQNTTGATDRKLTYRKTNEVLTSTINEHSHCAAWMSDGKGRTTENADHFHLVVDKSVQEARGHTHELLGIPCGPGSFEETDKSITLDVEEAAAHMIKMMKLLQEDIQSEREQPCKTC